MPPPPPPHPPATLPPVERPVHIARTDAKEYAVLIDQHGKLHWTGAETYGGRIIMLLGRDVPDAHLAELASDGISYIVSDEDGIDLERCLDRLLGDRATPRSYGSATLACYRPCFLIRVSRRFRCARMLGLAGAA